jgi:flagellar basal-body rod protein FlgB
MARSVLLSLQLRQEQFIMIGNLKAYLAPYVQGLDLRAYRQQVLASNIANADTPYYKARDFDFRAAFATAMDRRGGSGLGSGYLAPTRTNPRHLPSATGRATDAVNLQYRTEYQSAVDGNTVDMDVERAAIADNALHYQTLTTMLNGKLSGLRAAISSNQG